MQKFAVLFLVLTASLCANNPNFFSKEGTAPTLESESSEDEIIFPDDFAVMGEDAEEDDVDQLFQDNAISMDEKELFAN